MAVTNSRQNPLLRLWEAFEDEDKNKDEILSYLARINHGDSP